MLKEIGVGGVEYIRKYFRVPIRERRPTQFTVLDSWTPCHDLHTHTSKSHPALSVRSITHST